MHAETISALADRIRARIVRLTPQDRPTHVASALSIVEIVAAIYGDAVEVTRIRRGLPDRDRVVLSKGHGALALYAALAEMGIVDKEAIEDYGPGSALAPTHPLPGRLCGVDVATGSLGHGLALGAGMTLAHRTWNYRSRTIVVLGDGECQEGSVWEAAMFAAQQQLAALTVVVDANGLQQTGRTADISDLEPLATKWHAFGWVVEDVDGHDAAAVAAALGGRPPTGTGRPRVVLARTIKGRGLDAIENAPGAHFAAIPVAEGLR